MIHCPTCGYAWNPDSAVNCGQCRTPLRAPNPPVSSDTLNENARSQPASGGSRTPTGQAPTAPSPSNSAAASNYVAPQAPQQPTPDELRSDATRYYPVRQETPPPAGPETAPSARTPSADPGQNRKTAVAEESSLEKNTPTAANESARQQTVALGTRRIVGVLITYSWRDEGQVFPVLEGRNLIGKDPAQCDICIPQDTTLSAINSFITYRRQFVIGDRVSMSGTDVDGEPIETEVVPLRNYAKIRTGSTYWTFVSVQPPS
jgi:hypothetical protein